MSPQDAVSRWSSWEIALFGARPPSEIKRTILSLERGEAGPRPRTPHAGLHARSVQALSTIHYVVERGFFPAEFSLLEEARGFDFPLYIVHGRFDCVCPVKNAEDLAAAAPRSELR